MTSDNGTNTWHWQCHVALAMPRVTHKDLTRGIFFPKYLKKIKKITD